MILYKNYEKFLDWILSSKGYYRYTNNKHRQNCVANYHVEIDTKTNKVTYVIHVCPLAEIKDIELKICIEE